MGDNYLKTYYNINNKLIIKKMKYTTGVIKNKNHVNNNIKKIFFATGNIIIV